MGNAINTVVIYLYGVHHPAEGIKIGRQMPRYRKQSNVLGAVWNDVQHGGRQKNGHGTRRLFLFLARSIVHDPGSELPPEVLARDRAVNVSSLRSSCLSQYNPQHSQH